MEPSTPHPPILGLPDRTLPAFVVGYPPHWSTTAAPGVNAGVGVAAGHFRPRPALAVGRRAAAPAAMSMSDGGSGGGGSGSVQKAPATASRVLPSHLTAPPPSSAVVVTEGTMHGWAHPTLQPDGRFYGHVGEWGSFGPLGEPRRELSSAASTRTRSIHRRGARVWVHPPGAPATDMVHINLSSTDPKVGNPATLRDADGLYEKRWDELAPADPDAVMPPPAAGAITFFFTASGGGAFGFLGGPADGAAPFFELFLRGDPAAGWTVIIAWNEGAPHPELVSLIRESRVNGWEGVDGGAVELPAVPPATAPLPVDDWVGGYPGPTEADAGAGTATVTAVVGVGDGKGSDGRRLVSWTVTDGVRWKPVGGAVGDAGANRLVALEDGLYLSAMVNPRDGGVLEMGSATPPRPGQARQRTLVVLEPGAVVSRVVHEVYPPMGGSPAA